VLRQLEAAVRGVFAGAVHSAEEMRTSYQQRCSAVCERASPNCLFERLRYGWLLLCALGSTDQSLGAVLTTIARPLEILQNNYAKSTDQRRFRAVPFARCLRARWLHKGRDRVAVTAEGSEASFAAAGTCRNNSENTGGSYAGEKLFGAGGGGRTRSFTEPRCMCTYPRAGRAETKFAAFGYF